MADTSSVYSALITEIWHSLQGFSCNPPICSRLQKHEKLVCVFHFCIKVHRISNDLQKLHIPSWVQRHHMFIWKGRQDSTAVKHDSVLFLDPCLCKNIRERKKQPRKKAIKLSHSRYPNRKALKLTANSVKRNSNNKLNRG